MPGALTTELSPVTAPLLVYIKLASQLVVSYLYAIILIRNLIFLLSHSESHR